MQFNFRWAVLLLCTLSGPAVACSVSYLPSINLPISIKNDCSFRNADLGDKRFDRDVLEGGKALDRGNGKVAQRVTALWACQNVEYLVFSECQTGKAIAIAGEVLKGSEAEFPPVATIASIQPPFGEIRASKDDTVESLAATAQAKGLSFEVRGQPTVTSIDLWKRLPAHCGCKLFYPGSEGAKKYVSP